MDLIALQTFITNSNFFILFCSMLLYWLQSALLIDTKWGMLATLGILFSNFLQTGNLILRWNDVGHFPLSNLYESLLFLSWVNTFVLIIFNSKLTRLYIDKKQNNALKPKLTESNLVSPLIGSVLTPLILLVSTFASFSLPSELKNAGALVPALQSNWLVMHVTVMMLSYGALLCGCLLAICYLILVSVSKADSNIPAFEAQKNLNVHKNYSNVLQFNESNPTTDSLNFLINENKQSQRSQLISTLDNLSYRILSLGFPLLTIGILSGAVWANQTWGSYWSWDPKETWALITWFVFAIYLHTRISKGWTGKKSAFIALFGFMIIWICYLGVNLLGKGLHSYGFFS
uniref:Cytochrome c biogenesis protein CcsA n=1 Tax=Capsosiphon fulvescens TaxID=205396 RepID=A0A3G1RIW4_9CHLO|nr:heme attachment to plastid cytochrome c [Capsosiphon fulvescens]AWX64102.1 heme attachment to plastid cytochrome c [Capsosiphon fulvescens]